MLHNKGKRGEQFREKRTRQPIADPIIAQWNNFEHLTLCLLCKYQLTTTAAVRQKAILAVPISLGLKADLIITKGASNK
jgi:hypothetical protein